MWWCSLIFPFPGQSMGEQSHTFNICHDNPCSTYWLRVDHSDKHQKFLLLSSQQACVHCLVPNVSTFHIFSRLCQPLIAWCSVLQDGAAIHPWHLHQIRLKLDLKYDLQICLSRELTRAINSIQCGTGIGCGRSMLFASSSPKEFLEAPA